MSTAKGAPKPGMRIHALGTDGGIYYGVSYVVIGGAEQVAQSRLAPELRGPPFWYVVVECDAPCGVEGFAGPCGECRHMFLLSPDCWEEAS